MNSRIKNRALFRSRFFVRLALVVPFSLSVLNAQVLSTKISLTHWGIDSLKNVRYGEATLVVRPGGNEFSIGMVGTRPPGEQVVTVPISPSRDSVLIVSHFETGGTNLLGGRYGITQQSPSSAAVSIDSLADGRYALDFYYIKSYAGHCGAWITFFPAGDSTMYRRYLNAERFEYLSFWVRAELPGDNFILKIADKALHEKDSLITIGSTAEFLYLHSVDTTWQQLIFPLSRLPAEFDRSRIASLSIEPVARVWGRLFIKTLAFVTGRDKLPTLPPPAATRSADRLITRGLWIWNTSMFLDSSDEQARILPFLQDEKISDVYLYIPSRGADPSAPLQIDTAVYKPLLRSLHESSIRVHALLGEKEYALPERSPFVLSSVQNILDYSLRADSLEKFDGIHFDIEPHLLPDFKTGQRDSILVNYISILSRCAELIHTSGLIAGADIPFWFDALADSSNKNLMLPYNRFNKPLYQHVIDIMDQTVLMDYRTTAAGPNGAVALAADEILYAAQANKKIMIGLETGTLPDEHLLLIRGPAENGLNAWNVGDLNIIMIPERDSVVVYLMPAENFKEFEQQLQNSRLSADKIFHWPVRRNVLVSSSHLTFSRLGYQSLQKVAADIEKEFLPFQSYGGIAIHHYESYKKLRDAVLR